MTLRSGGSWCGDHWSDLKDCRNEGRENCREAADTAGESENILRGASIPIVFL